MKNLLILISVFLVTEKMVAQVHITDIKIIPDSSSVCSRLYVVADLFGGCISPSNLSYYQNLSSVSIERCFTMCALDVVAHYMGTVSIGYLQEGEYSLHYTVRNSQRLDSCISYSEYDTSFVFSVSGSIANCDNLSEIENVSHPILINVYPNPATSTIQFSEKADVQLANITGQLITEKRNVNELDVSTFSSGIYMLTLTDKRGEVQRIKVVKE